MALFRKNRGNQILFCMVRSGDGSFARHAAESDLSLAAPKYFGVANGSAAASTSGLLSRMPSLVASGIFRQSLKAAECNFDMALYKFGDDTQGSLAVQIIPITFFTLNDVGLSSMLSDAQSNILNVRSAVRSRAAQLYSQASEIQSNLLSEVQQGPSLVWAEAIASDLYSKIGKVRSQVSAVGSDIQSTVASRCALVAAAVWADATGSDIYSKVGKIRSQVSGVASDIQSTIASRCALVPAAIWADATGSDIYSKVGKIRSQMSAVSSDVQSTIISRFATVATASQVGAAVWADPIGSDVYSKVGKVRSQMSGIGSDILSGIAAAPSLVWAYATGSDIYSKVGKVMSEIGTLSDDISSVYSLLNDTYSAIGDVSVTIAASDVSSISSQVVEAIGADIGSLVWGDASASDLISKVGQLRSQISEVGSDIQSTVRSQISNTQSVIQSDLDSIYSLCNGISDAVEAARSTAIDAASLASGAESRAEMARVAASIAADLIISAGTSLYLLGLRTESMVSDTLSLLTDVNSNVDGIYSNLSDVRSDLSADISNVHSLVAKTKSQMISRVPGIAMTRTQALTELTDQPGATPNAEQAIMFLYMGARNQCAANSALVKVYDNAGAAICSATLNDDGITFTRGKMS